MKLANLIRGNHRGAVTMRILLSALLVAGAGVAGGFATPASAAPADGTVKIDGKDVTDPNDPANDPKLECAIPMEFQGFDNGTTFNATITFEGQGNQPNPTVSGGDLTPTFVGVGPGVALFQTYYVAGADHIKITVVIDNGYNKFKVFKVKPCPAPTFTVVKSNNANGDQAFGTSEQAPAAGAAVPFKATITNTSPYSITVSAITDSIDGAAGVAVTCSPALTTILAGASTDCSFTLPGYAPAAGGSKVNTVRVTANQVGDTAVASSVTSNQSTVTTPAGPNPAPSFTVVKSNNANGDQAFGTSEQAPAVGAAVPFKVTITNNSGYPIDVSDVSDSIDGAAGVPVTCALTTIANGASADCLFTMPGYAPAAGGSKVNTVTVTANEAGVAANSGSVTSNQSTVTTPAGPNPAPSFTVVKSNNANGDQAFGTSEQAPAAGAAVPFKVTITNNSGYPIDVSAVSDSIDGAAGVPVACSPALTTIANGASADCLFTMPGYAPAAGGSKVNTVTVTANEAGVVANSGSATSNQSTVTTAAVIVQQQNPLAADLAVKKTGPASVTPGGTATWALTVTNKGPGNASGFTVTDTLPAGVTLSSLSGTNFTCTAATLVCTFTSVLLPTQTAVVTVVGDVSSAISGTSIANVVVVGPTDATPADNTDTLVSAIDRPAAPADLVLEKAGPAVAVAGEQVTWTITVTNAGGQDATGFTVGDPLANGVALVSGGGAGWFCTTNLPLACVFPGTLAPGETAALEVTGLVDADYDATSITNTASVPLANDPTPENNSDSVTVPVAVPIEGGEEEPATGSPSPSPLPDLPFVPEEEAPDALPFTGSSTDQLLGVGALLSLLGLMLIVTGRRRRTVG